MELTQERLESLLRYCRISEPDDGELQDIKELYASAVGYMKRAGVTEPGEEDEGRRAQYNLCVNYLVLDAYDQKQLTVGGTTKDNPAFRMYLNQLKYTEPDPSGP